MTIGKTLGFIALIIIILHISLTLFMTGAFNNEPMIVLTSGLLLLIGIPLSFVSLFIKRISTKAKQRCWAVGLVIIILPCVIRWIDKTYDDSFARLDEQAVELYRYRPFIPGSKVAILPEPSTLKFAADLYEEPKLIAAESESIANEQLAQLKNSEYLPKLDGARALYPVYAAFGQAVYPEQSYDFDSEIGYHNTIEAYKKLITRKVDMIFVASPSQEQRALAKENQVVMKFTPIGKEAFVFFVNAKNPIDGLSSEEIRAIYAGKITNWKQVGGKNQSIHAFQRNEGSGSQTALINFMNQEPLMTPPITELSTGMGGIIKRAADYANYSGSIGFSFRYFTQTLIANNEIKLLNIDGVYPTQDTMRSGDYPLIGEFYAVTLADNAEPNVQKLLEWILSPQGQYLIEETGYVGIN